MDPNRIYLPVDKFENLSYTGTLYLYGMQAVQVFGAVPLTVPVNNAA
jgi:hypothetical protein